jgi:catechol 2,3-dioxygenase-like lactoylglutathione lyase family enzyme
MLFIAAKFPLRRSYPPAQRPRGFPHLDFVTRRRKTEHLKQTFYRNVLGMELLYGGEQESFSSLRANNSESAILNLEQGDTVPRWGRLIFHVTYVDAFWTHLKERGFNPEIPRDASWGERYFHMLDPDGHELSFARPLP